MEWYVWYLLLIVIFAVYVQHRRRMQQMIHKHMMRKNRKEENIMNELIKTYIGKRVIIYTGFSTVDGTLTKIEDGWAEIEKKNGNELINLEYISRIQEYPQKKKSKKEAVRGLFEE